MHNGTVAKSHKESTISKLIFDNYEVICGLILAVFAALMAINDISAGNVEEEEMLASNEKANMYSWYQAKSIKQSLAKGQADMVRSLVDSNLIPTDKTNVMKNTLDELDAKVDRYDKEMNEILEGSQTVGMQNWAQDIDGKLGEIVGAKEHEKKCNALIEVGNVFDVAAMYLQISLVIGAVSLLFKKKVAQAMFFVIMLVVGLLGVCYTISAWQALSKVG